MKSKLMALGTDKPPLNDIRIRQALGLSIDRDDFIKTMTGGKGQWALASAVPGQFSDQEIKQILKFDPQQARQLVAAAGYPNGVDIELIYGATKYGQEHIDQVQLIQSYAKKGNINIKLAPLEDTTEATRQKQGDFQIDVLPSTVKAGDLDGIIFALYYSTSGSNYGHIRDPKLDQMLVAQRKEMDATKRKDLIRQAVRYINDQVYGLGLYDAPEYWPWQPYVKGFALNLAQLNQHYLSTWLIRAKSGNRPLGCSLPAHPPNLGISCRIASRHPCARERRHRRAYAAGNWLAEGSSRGSCDQVVSAAGREPQDGSGASAAGIAGAGDSLQHAEAGSGTTAGSPAAGRPRAGGQVNAAQANVPVSFDTSTKLVDAARGLTPINESLMSFKAGPSVKYTDLQIQPALAEKWETPDPQTYTFHLRSGVKWQNLPPVNGRGFDSSDVKWTYEYMARLDPFTKLPLAPAAAMFTGIDHVDAPDPSTVVVHFSQPFAPFLGYAASQWIPVLAHEIFDADGDFKTKAVGTGPFYLDTAASQTGTKLVHKKNPTYWRPDRPYVDALNLLILTDQPTINSGLPNRSARHPRLQRTRRPHRRGDAKGPAKRRRRSVLRHQRCVLHLSQRDQAADQRRANSEGNLARHRPRRPD